MDPFIWHRQCLSLIHDHPYCRKHYQEAVKHVCVESNFKPDVLKTSASDFNWVDVVDDSSTRLTVPEEYDVFLRKFAGNPPTDVAPKCEKSITTQCFWNVPTGKLFRRLKKMLVHADLENSIYQNKFSDFSPMDCKFRRHSHHELIVRRVARYARKMFGLLNWRMETCIELHEKLLNCLPSNILLIYLEGFVSLLHQNRISDLLSRLNADVRKRGEVSRFVYADFLDWVDKSISSDSFSCPSRQRTCHPHSESVGTYTPISFIHPAVCTNENRTRTPTTITSSPTKMEENKNETEPIFVCVLSGDARRGRISCLLKSLSSSSPHHNAGDGSGRVLLLDDERDMEDEGEEAKRHTRLRQLNRRLLVLMEESKSAPVYLVGFGLACSLVLIAALQLPPQPGLENVLCGRLTGTENPMPLKPWLAGIVCIGMPFTHNVDKLTVVAKKCSILLVVGERSHYGGDKEANQFRDACVTARKLHGNSAFASNNHLTIAALPLEFDLQLVILGGADHLLRLHPATAKRWSATQKSIDSAITISIKNFVIACRSLSNLNAAPDTKLNNNREYDVDMELPVSTSGGYSSSGLRFSHRNPTGVSNIQHEGLPGTARGFSIEARFRGLDGPKNNRTSSPVGFNQPVNESIFEGFEISSQETRYYSGHRREPSQEPEAYYRHRNIPQQLISRNVIGTQHTRRPISQLLNPYASEKTNHSPLSSPISDPYAFDNEVDDVTLRPEKTKRSISQISTSISESSQQSKKISIYGYRTNHPY